jgi:hypothetical protein
MFSLELVTIFKIWNNAEKSLHNLLQASPARREAKQEVRHGRGGARKSKQNQERPEINKLWSAKSKQGSRPLATLRWGRASGIRSNIGPRWDNVLAVCAVEAERRCGVGGFSPEGLLARLSHPSREWLWRIRIALPSPVAKHLPAF